MRKKNIMWFDQHSNRVKVYPGPGEYAVDDSSTKQTRFNRISLGYDVKQTAKAIKQTPGPQSYNTEAQVPTLQEFKNIMRRNRLMSAQSQKQKSQHSIASISPRQCSMAVPMSGDPFTPTGSLK